MVGKVFRGSASLRGSPPRGADVTIGSKGVQCAVHGERLVLRYDEIIVDVNGVDGSVVIRVTERELSISSREDGFADALIEGLGDRAEEHLVAFARSRGKRRGALKWFTIFGAAALTLMIVLALLPSVAVWTVDLLPTTVDARIGEAAANSLVAIGPRVEDPVIDETLNAVVAHLRPHAGAGGFELEIEVRQSGLANAVALPGGQMVITTALLELASGPEQVAAVIAHEIAHVTLRHGLRSFMRGAGFLVVVTLLTGDDDSVASLVAGGAAMVVLLSHSRETELAADTEGLAIMGRAGVDGRALAQILRRMQAARGTGGVEIPEWARTHPQTEARIQAIESLAAEDVEVPVSAIEVEWSRFEAAMGRRRLVGQSN